MSHQDQHVKQLENIVNCLTHFQLYKKKIGSSIRRTEQARIYCLEAERLNSELIGRTHSLAKKKWLKSDVKQQLKAIDDLLIQQQQMIQQVLNGLSNSSEELRGTASERNALDLDFSEDYDKFKRSKFKRSKIKRRTVKGVPTYGDFRISEAHLSGLRYRYIRRLDHCISRNIAIYKTRGIDYKIDERLIMEANLKLVRKVRAERRSH